MIRADSRHSRFDPWRDLQFISQTGLEAWFASTPNNAQAIARALRLIAPSMGTFMDASPVTSWSQQMKRSATAWERSIVGRQRGSQLRADEQEHSLIDPLLLRLVLLAPLRGRW